MNIIGATKGYSILVDEQDYERLSQFSWYAHKCREEWRPARRTSVKEGRKVVYLYHEIIAPRPGFVIDHINGNPWDNRRCNLRECTNAQNLLNRKVNEQSALGLKGVRKHPRGNRYAAQISVGGKRVRLGTFAGPVEAARAYDEAARQLHGEFARPNFPEVA